MCRTRSALKCAQVKDVKKTAVWSPEPNAKHGGLRACAQVGFTLLRQQRAHD